MTFNPADLESLIARAQSDGWGFFDGLDDETKKRADVEKARQMEENAAICQAWADFYRSEGGRKALETLFDATLRRTTWFSQIGVPMDQMAVFGAFREGQNAFAHAIARCIAKGMGDDLKAKET